MFHLRPGQPDQRQLYQHPLLGRIADLVRQIRKHPDVTHQCLPVRQTRVLFQKPQVFRRHIYDVLRVLRRLRQQEVAQIPDKIRHKLGQVPTLDHHLFQLADTVRRPVLRHRPEHAAEDGGVHGPQHIQHLVIRQSLPVVEGDTLIQKAQGIAHRAVRRPRDIGEGLCFRVDLLRRGQFFQPVRDRRGGDPPEIIPLAAGEHRDRNPVHLRGRQDKNHIRRRLLQRLEQGVEGARR